jgi:hypothetical protein
MRTIISLSALGLTLALGGAAVANPLDRSAGFGKQMQTYRLHKRIYAHDQKRSVVTDRLQERRETSAVGTASTAGGKPGRG